MPKENVADGVLFVKVKDMKGDRIDVDVLHRTKREIAAMYERASLKTGDVLLAIRGTYGRFHQRITKQLIANYGWLFGDKKGWVTTVQPLLDGLLQQRNSLPDPTTQRP